MSNEDRPEFRALEELRQVLTTLTGELASWRRRALKAEGEQSQLGLDHELVSNRERIVALEAENVELQRRGEVAQARLAELLGQLRFLEQQVAMEEQGR